MTSWQFEFYNSLPFWGALALAVVAVRAVGGRPRARAVATLLASGLMLLAIPRFGAGGLAAVAGLALVSLLVARSLCLPGGDGPRRRLVAVAGVAAVLGFLACFKYRGLQSLLLSPWRGGPAGPGDFLFLLGVSYFSFKAIHTLVEAYKRTLPAVDPLIYLNYILFFPAFISGPISRYPQFATQLGPLERGAWRRDLALGGERIVHGLFKKLVLVALLAPYVLGGQGRPLASAQGLEVLTGLYAFALYTYFDFSGYSDLAIGAGRLLGVELPENFDWPFLQRNLRELWSAWHKSLTSWLVDYIYWPIVRRLRSVAFLRQRPLLLSAVAMNATFLACGAWHGEALRFLLWGAYHGLGITLLQVYQRQKRRIPSAAVQRYFQSRASRIAGAIGTFHFFIFGLALFLVDLEGVRDLFRALLFGAKP